MQIRCPHCQNGIELVDDSDFQSIDCPSCGSQFGLVDIEQTEIDTLSKSRGTTATIGHFELIEEVGRGAFGTVWRARDAELDRPVAIKIPRGHRLSTDDHEQFLREARAAAQLSHPNIVTVYEVGRDGEQLYIVSDFVEGVTLAEKLTAQRLAPREAVALCVKIAAALEHAHENGVIHRDLKPSNIMLTADDEPRVMDFGLAKRDAGEITMTVEGKVLGTPAYMPPEQARGEGHHVDRRADVYSLGVILYELLSGELPFRGATRMLLHQVIHDEAPSPRKLNSAIPRDLETITLKCLQKDPGRRYQSAAKLVADLECWQGGKPINTRPVTWMERSWRWCKRKPVVAGLFTTTALLLLALAIGGLVFAVQQTENARQQTKLRGKADAERNQTAVERDRAEENFQYARAAVDQFYLRVSEDGLLKAEGLQPLRVELLTQALMYYQKFLNQRQGDPKFALDLAIVRSKMGSILSDIGDPKESLTANQEATSALTTLHTNEPRNADIIDHLVESLENEAVELDRLERTEEALEQHSQALEYFRLLSDVTGKADPVKARQLWGRKGAFEAKLQMLDDAEMSYEKSLSIVDDTELELSPLGVAIEPAKSGVVVLGVKRGFPAETAKVQVGDVLVSIAGVEIRSMKDMGKIREHLKANQLQPLVVLRSGNTLELDLMPVYLGDFTTANTKYNFGSFYHERIGDQQKAQQWLEAAIDEFRRALLRPSSNAAGIRDGLAMASTVLGTCGYRQGDMKLYEKGTREAALVAGENARMNPAVPRYHRTAGINLTNLSTFLWRKDDIQPAITAIESAVTHFKQALERGGNLPSDRSYLMQGITNLALIRSDHDGPQTVIPIYDSALEVAAGFGPEIISPPLAFAIARLHRNRASTMRDTGNLSEAARSYDSSAAHYEKAISLLEIPPPHVLEEAATMHLYRASVFARLSNSDKQALALDASDSLTTQLSELSDTEDHIMTILSTGLDAYFDAACQTYPHDFQLGKSLQKTAETYLETLQNLPDNSEHLASAQGQKAICLLRRDLCGDMRATAWKHFADVLNGEDIADVLDNEDNVASLSIPMRVDLAASLIMDQRKNEAESLIASFSGEDVSPASRKALTHALEELKACGVPAEVINSLIKMP